MAHRAEKIAVHSAKAGLNRRTQKALISLGLEGITLTKESIDDLNSFDRGLLTKEEVLSRVVARAKTRK